MAVQDAQAPCRHDQQRRSGEENLYQPDRELAGFAVETGHDDVDQPRGGEHSCQRDQRRNQEEDGKDRFGQLIGFLVPLFRPQASVHGNKRSGKDALAEEGLQEVWNAKSAAERIRSIGIPEDNGRTPARVPAR